MYRHIILTNTHTHVSSTVGKYQHINIQFEERTKDPSFCWWFVGSFELFQKLGSLEVFRNLFVEAGNDFVDLLLPARLGVLARLHRVEELSEGHVEDGHEMLRHLLNKKNRKKLIQVSLFCFQMNVLKQIIKG